MTKKEFLDNMKDVLQTDAELTCETVLDDLEEWDSLSIMATMSFLNKNFNVRTSINDYREMTTIGDIAAKAGV